MKHIKTYEDLNEYIPKVGDFIYLKLTFEDDYYPTIYEVTRERYENFQDSGKVIGYFVKEICNDKAVEGTTNNKRYSYKKASDEDVEKCFLNLDVNKYNL